MNDELIDRLALNLYSFLLKNHYFIIFRFKFSERLVGFYAVNFFGDGSFSDAYLFKTEFDANKIEVIDIITSKFDDKIGTPCGEPLDSVKKNLNNIKFFDNKSSLILLILYYSLFIGLCTSP